MTRRETKLAVALAANVALRGATCGITIACAQSRKQQAFGAQPGVEARPGRLPSSRAFCLYFPCGKRLGESDEDP
jgi:hypothetical protein